MALCFSVCGGCFYAIVWIAGGVLALYFGIKYELNK